VSLHFEWTLSMWLRADAPEAFLAELRFHLGDGSARASGELPYDYPVFAPGVGDALPGGPVASLTRQSRCVNRPAMTGLFIRAFITDDTMYDLIQTVPPWLARWSATQGWIGFAREGLELDPWLHFYVQDGYAYLAAPGQTPAPVSADAPQFSLTQTTERS
jgi:hypothetical protein